MSSETIVPIADVNRGWKVWNKSEIFTGSGFGKYVPNVEDIVVDLTLGFFKVTEVNLSTGLSTLEPLVFTQEDEALSQQDIILGVDVAAQAESYRVYIDKSVWPYSLSCDSRLHIYGSSNSHVKLFKGVDISENGVIISEMYSPDGDLLSENIPLELVATVDATNVAIKSPVVAQTRTDLDDGEVVTAVVYDDLGHLVSYSKLLVKNTSFVRKSESAQKQIVRIHIESPFLDLTDERTLKFPINMAVKDLSAMGVVTYSDGSTKKVPVNSDGFELLGLDSFISSVVGQRVPLVLSYKVGANETTNSAINSTKITESYWGVVTEQDEAYSVKMFMFPEWVDDVVGYRLRFFLTTLERQKIYEVTNLVKPTSISDVFLPNMFGQQQKLSYSVEMSDVDPKYAKYKFVQPFEVTLLNDGTYFDTRWLVNFHSGQPEPFGAGIEAKINLVDVDNSKLDISNGMNSLDEWLRNVFYVGQPLVNTKLEERAPQPNIMIIKTKRRSYTVDIGMWDKEINIVNDLSFGELVVIELVNRVYENDVLVGVVALPVTVV